MRKLFQLSVLAAALVAVCACSNEREEIKTIKITSAGAYLLQEEELYSVVNMYMTDSGVVENEASFSGVGCAAWIDMNITAGASSVPQGTYGVIEGNAPDGDVQDYLIFPGDVQDYLIFPGEETESGELIGTFVYERASERQAPFYHLIDGGYVRVKRNGSAYRIEALLKSGARSFRFSYSGPLALTPLETEDGSGDGGSGDSGSGDGGSGDGGSGSDAPEVIQLTTLTQGEMDYYGNAAWEGQPSNLYDWELYLAESGFDFDTFDGDGYLVQMEVFCETSDAIATGRYEMSMEMENFAVSEGWEYEDTEAGDVYQYGTWIYDSWEPLYAATDGYVEISRDGSNYTVDFNFTDEEWNGIFKGKYTGPLGYYDATQDYETASLAPAKKKARMEGRKTGVRRIRLRKVSDEVAKETPRRSAYRK